MFDWNEKLNLALAFARRSSVKGICSIGRNKATFATAAGNQSFSYYALDSMTTPEFIYKLAAQVCAKNRG